MSKRTFEIYRYDPEQDDKPRMQVYEVEITPQERMLLDALIKIKAVDPTLAFRRSCREGVCGSDAMNINGKNGLACQINLNELPNRIILRPLPGLPVVRDLICDMTEFFDQYHAISPWVENDGEEQSDEKEQRQSPQSRELLNGLYECILCACCSTACPSFWWKGSEGKFLGPAALLAAARFLLDDRDQKKAERLEFLKQGERTLGCHSIGNCTYVCPKGLDPNRAIHLLTSELIQTS